MDLTLSPKQALAIQLLDNPQVVDITFGGGAGGGKTLLVCLWLAMRCRKYPGIREGLGRKELSRLKQTTLVSLLREAHPILGVSNSDYQYNDHKHLVTYRNGSSIQLVDLSVKPTDPDVDKMGSQNFTDTIIEEVGEVNKKARDTFTSRKNRFLNEEYGIVGKSICTCNPSQNYIKQEFYKPYKELGGGSHRTWRYGDVEVDGKLIPAYRAFVQSLVTDNPFISRNYIEVLRKLPDAERRRLLEGNWDFADDDLLLFKSQVIDRSLINEITGTNKFIGVDIADKGKDRTIITLVEGTTITEQLEIDVDTTGPIGEQIAYEIIKFAQQHGLSSANARNIAIDVIGVGASTRDFLRARGWYVREFVAGERSVGNFKNLRAENLWNMSVAFQQGKFHIYRRLATLDTLREDLLAHEYTTEERTILVKSKKDIKESLGRSPDHAESAYIAYWVSQGDTDPKNDPSRVSW